MYYGYFIRDHLLPLHMHVLKFQIHKYRWIAIFQLAPVSPRSLILCCPLPVHVRRACFVFLLAHNGRELQIKRLPENIWNISEQ